MRSRARLTSLLLAVFWSASGSTARAGAASGAASVPSTAAARERRLVIFYTTEVHGTPEPCGCTAEPLGGLSRLATLVRGAHRGSTGVLLIDGGDLLYSQPTLPARERPAAELVAGFLADQLGKLGLAGSAVGESDLARGPAAVRPHRLAANLKAPFVEAARIVEAGGIKVGLVGMAEPSMDGAVGSADQAVQAVRRDAERLRGSGAELIVALAAVERPLARRLAREAPVDLVLVGRHAGEGSPRAEQAGRAFLLAPADELRRVGRLELVLRSGGPALRDAGGGSARDARKLTVERKVGELNRMLASWNSDRNADAAFVAERKRERDALAAELATLQKPFAPPADGSYFVNELVPLSRSIPQDARVVQAQRALDRKVATVNLAAAAPPPTAGPGRAAFVGEDACRPCHADAAAAWRSTHHARAWKTLVAVGKQADYKCVRCHATGFGQIGGSSLGHTRKLEAVQCESCHGPGSLHAANPADHTAAPIQRQVPEAVCTDCHNEHHSDSFQYQGYLRDILGPQHGADARNKLGAGPGAKELRAGRRSAVVTGPLP